MLALLRPFHITSRLTTRQLSFGVLCGALFISLFWPTFTWLTERFDAPDSFYSHGWLIPLASGWLMWQRRAQWQSCPQTPSFRGLLLLVPSLLVHLIANSLNLHFVSGFAMLGVVWGLVWTCWGWQRLWRWRFPMLFLFFMVPLPGVLLISISFKMKMWAATLATHVLHWMQIPAVQAGSTIDVPGISVIVDDTCSGLRSLISLIALSTLWTSLMPPSSQRWQKLAVVAASIPIALAANMVRIVVLVLLAAIYGPKAAEGFLHYGSGIVVFAVALIALAWLSRWIEQWSPPSLDLNQLPSSS